MRKFILLLLMFGGFVFLPSKVEATDCSGQGHCAYVCLPDCVICNCSCGSGYYECSTGCCPVGTPVPTEPPCDCSNWANSACGNTTNGCAYEQRVQTRSCDNNCDIESRCVADLSCPWPGIAQGFKVSEPGTVTTGHPNVGANVTLAGVGSSVANPYGFTWTTSAGGARAESVPAVAGYDIGYTLCYNAIACHTSANIVNGRSVILSEDSIRSCSGATCYADLWWHYCPNITPPASLTVAGVSAANFVCLGGGTANIQWSGVAGAYMYALRVDDLANGWSGTCVSPNAGDYCVDNISGGATSYTINIQLGHTYRVWMHTINSCRGWSGSVGMPDFSVVAAPAQPTNIATRDDINKISVTWTDNSVDETSFSLTRSAAFPAPATRTVVSATRNTTGTGYSYLDQPPDMSCGVAYQYCVAASVSDYPAPCQNSIPLCAGPFSCADYSNAWFQTQGGGITAGGGQLSMNMPPQPPLTVPPLPTPVWQMDGEPALPISPQGNPGVVYGSGFGGTVTSVPATEINSRGWLANVAPGWGALPAGSGALVKPENSFDVIRQRVVSRVTPRLVAAASLDEVTLRNMIDTAVAANKILGVTILEKPAGGGDLTLSDLDGNLDLGNRQVVIFVDGGVFLNSRISSTGMVSVIARGNISVDAVVGQDPLPSFPYQANIANDHITYPYHINGVYYTQGVFSTGGGNKQLKINGSIVGMAGINFGRASFGPYPAEFVHFNAKATKILRDVGLRRIVRQELVAP